MSLKINYLAVIAAAVAALVEGALWYSPLLFGEAWMRLRGIDPAVGMTLSSGEIIAQFIRDLVVAYVLARLVAMTGVSGWTRAARLGLWVWLGFQATAVVGAVIHENYPWKLCAIHAGDALVKTISMALIIGLWRPRDSSVKKGV